MSAAPVSGFSTGFQVAPSFASRIAFTCLQVICDVKEGAVTPFLCRALSGPPSLRNLAGFSIVPDRRTGQLIGLLALVPTNAQVPLGPGPNTVSGPVATMGPKKIAQDRLQAVLSE